MCGSKSKLCVIVSLYLAAQPLYQSISAFTKTLILAFEARLSGDDHSKLHFFHILMHTVCNPIKRNYFQATALEMIHDIRDAFNDLLEENAWMDTETRLVAEDKANSMTERIGYPEYITNDTRLEEEYKNVS